MSSRAIAAIAVALVVPLLQDASSAGETSSTLGHIRMRRDVYIAEEDSFEFPRPAEGDQLPCAGQTAGGYLVVATDTQGIPRMALLPHRTEWGHATAALWEHDPSMVPHTLTVRNPVDLRRGAIPLLKGQIYGVSSSNETSVTITFTSGPYSREIALEQGDFEAAPASELAGPKTREDRARAALDMAQSLQKALRTELREAETRRERLANLLEQLEVASVENAELRAQLNRANTTYRELAKWQPQNRAELQAMEQRLGKTIGEQGQLMTRLKRANFDAEPLRLLHKQMQDANGEVEDLRIQLASRRAEVEALRSKLPHEYIEDNKQLDELLAAARDEHAELTRLLSQTERGHEGLSALFETLGRLEAENALLNGRIAELMQEIETIRLAMGNAAGAKEPKPEPVRERAPAPAPEPAEAPEQAPKDVVPDAAEK